MSYKFLVTGDIHLGRRTVHPSAEINDPQLSVSHSWQRLIETAIEHQVEAVLITGDLIDKENAWFEALHSLKSGLQQLDQNDIKVYAVAGNHDALVLSQLDEILAEIPCFSLLGKGRQWEQVQHQCRDGNRIEIAGWSFDKEHLQVNPVASGVPEPGGSLSITLLHTDLNGPPDSRYAPVSERELIDSGRPIWLLGHIHKLEVVREGSPFILYPGSPHSLHANETGMHGPWMMNIASDGRVHAEQIPLSPIRYEEIEISLDDLPEDWKSEFLSRVMQQFKGDQSTPVQWNVIDVICTGDPTHFDAIDQYFQQDETEREIGGSPSIYIRKFVNRTSLPPANLESMAERANLEGILARLLIQLDQPENSDALKELLQEAGQVRQKVLRHDVFKPIHDDQDEEASEPVTAEESEELLKQAAREWLTELRKQSEEMQR